MKWFPFAIVAGLFGSKLLMNALAAVALFHRPLGPNDEEPGVSLMPYAEVALLVVLVGLAAVGLSPISVSATTIGGFGAIVASYLAMVALAAVLSFITRLAGRNR